MAQNPTIRLQRLNLLHWLSLRDAPVPRAEVREYFDWDHEEIGRVLGHSLWFICKGAFISVSEYGQNILNGEPETVFTNPRTLTPTERRIRKKKRRQDMSVLKQVKRPKVKRSHKQDREERLQGHADRIARGL